MGEKRYKDETVLKSSELNECISTIINFFIRNKSKKVVDIKLFTNFLSLRIYGDFKEELEFDAPILKSLVKLTNEVYFITVLDNIKTTKALDFSNSQYGMYNEKSVSTLQCDDNTNSMGFIFYKSSFKLLLKELEQEDNVKLLKNYINERYSDALSYLKIRYCGQILEPIEKQGILLTERTYKDKYDIQVYKMFKNCKTLDFVVNGVKLNGSLLKGIINWNRYPYRQKGYSFRRLCIFISINFNEIDLNDKKVPLDILKENQDEISDIINEVKGRFRKDAIYFNLEYDKNKMNEIVKQTKCRSPLQAVKFVLDEFYKEI